MPGTPRSIANVGDSLPGMLTSGNFRRLNTEKTKQPIFSSSLETQGVTKKGEGSWGEYEKHREGTFIQLSSRMTKDNLGASFPGEELWDTVESLRPGGGLRAQASHLSLFTWVEGLATIPHQDHSRGKQLCSQGRVSYLHGTLISLSRCVELTREILGGQYFRGQYRARCLTPMP